MPTPKTLFSVPRVLIHSCRWLALCLLLVACQPKAPVQEPRTVVDMPLSAEQGGALSGGVVAPPVVKPNLLEGTQWPEIELTSGRVMVRCDADQAGPVVGSALADLTYESVNAALSPCRDGGVVRVQYHGKIGTDFTAMVERVANVADRLGLQTRILELDSSGGHVEDAMKAGDAIGASKWRLWVSDPAICHSACVLILAAGDDREITGKVGIHRMIRIGSAATTRAELAQELRDVHANMKDYLERNGAAVAIADLMMTVPNRKLRLLTERELQEFGLQGTNAVQDDLERIQLTRKCGEDFVRRKDDFERAYARACAIVEQSREAQETCGLALRTTFGFPDETCPQESPLSALKAVEQLHTEQAGIP